MVSTVSTYSKEWYKLRKTNLGASEIAALCGLDPWKQPHEVWESKHTENVFQPEHGVNSHVWWGHQEESAIITAATFLLEDSEKFCHTGTSWYSDGLMVSPDAVLLDTPTWVEKIPERKPSLIEAKTVGESVASRWVDGPPTYVLMQAYTQMYLMRATQNTIAARIAGAPVKIWTVTDPGNRVGAVIAEIVAKFWETKVMPDDWMWWVTSLLRDVGVLKAPKEFKKRQVESLEEMILVNEWVQAKAAVRAAEKEANDLKEQIDSLLGDDHDAIVDMEGNVILIAEERQRNNFDVRALLEDSPELDSYYTKTSYRQYVVPKVKA